ncbi:hypothetical protein [Mycobacteroides sp. H072]|uniref:hypothetical protein n=1 Tax=Mycobacteroides sp. H072 TaxID=1720568 RepID=UPI000A7421FF|nr:hypothetical protein [Mycobacteroides sp. H072]
MLPTSAAYRRWPACAGMSMGNCSPVTPVLASTACFSELGAVGFVKASFDLHRCSNFEALIRGRELLGLMTL